jgi:hypothetical protein
VQAQEENAEANPTARKIAMMTMSTSVWPGEVIKKGRCSEAAGCG